MGKKVRVSKAAEILGVSPATIRNWSNDGRLEFTLSAAKQRLFDVDYLHEFLNPDEANVSKSSVFYVRTSGKSDVGLENQIEKLTSQYGEADKVFRDTASGLSERRNGLTALFDYCKENPSIVYVCNQDRLSRFGFAFIERLLGEYDSEIVVLDSDETKEPHAVLMQDFMSLLASFSGKFYRLRGWEQQRKFLGDTSRELENRASSIS